MTRKESYIFLRNRLICLIHMYTKLINNKKNLRLGIKFLREKHPEKKLFLFDPDPDQNETDPPH